MRYIVFLLFENKTVCGYSLEYPHQDHFNEIPQHMFSLRNKKNINFQVSKSGLDKNKVELIINLFLGQVMKYDNS